VTLHERLRAQVGTGVRWGAGKGKVASSHCSVASIQLYTMYDCSRLTMLPIPTSDRDGTLPRCRRRNLHHEYAHVCIVIWCMWRVRGTAL